MPTSYFTADLERAQTLASQDKMGESLDLFRKLCMDARAQPDEKYAAVQSLLDIAPDAGNDIVVRWCDSAPFMETTSSGGLNEVKYDLHQDLLDKMVVCPGLNSHEKLMIVVNQYNQGVLDRCYTNFTKLIEDSSVLLNHRIEACRYLFASTDSRYKDVAQTYLLSIINTTHDYSSLWRYKIIANYISKTGVGTATNFAKLPVEYDEDFVHSLQTAFFTNADNGTRERILSGQNLLEMKTVSPQEQTDVETVLVAVADDPATLDNLRADAADVLIRMTKGETKARAQAIIAALGYSAVRTRDRTVYSDRQNVHTTEISTSAREFIHSIVLDSDYVPGSFLEVHNEVSSLVRSSDLVKEDRDKCYRALDRISIDTSTFTEYNLGIADVFCYVWLRVKTHPEFREELEKRILEELVDMADTCSSGHTWRFVNVLSVYEGSILKISWDDQIKANIVGRMSARLRDIEDDTLKDLVALGSMENADPGEAKAFRRFADTALGELYHELRKEFVVDGGHVPLDQFDVYFKDGASRYK